MRDEICGVLSAVEDCSREEFIADETRVLASALHFTRLAERPLKASSGYRAAHPEIPWENLAHVRERVEPELFHDDAAAMWDIAARELPAILDALEALLPPDDLWRYRRAARDSDGETAWPAVEPDVTLRISIPLDALEEICRRYDVRRIRFFGSVLRDDFGPESDVDMMVDFGPGAPGGWGIFRFDEELSDLLGRKADVLHGQPVRYIRDQVLVEAKTVYVAPDATKADNEAGT